MMKLTKRIIALAIVICTLGAMMIPGVTVSAEGEDFTVVFADDVNQAGVTKLHASNTALNTDQAALLDTAYNNKTNDWKLYSNNGSYVFSGRSPKVNATNKNFWISSTAAAAFYYPLEIRTPAAGEYKLKANFLYDSNVSEIGAYVVELTDGGFTADTLPKHDSDLAQAKITLNAKGKKESDTTVSLKEGKTYLVVFYGVGTQAGAYTQIDTFSLTYQGPLPIVLDTDYLDVDFAADCKTLNTTSHATDEGLAQLESLYNEGQVNWNRYKNDENEVVYSGRMGNRNNYGFLLTAPANTESYVPLSFRVPRTGDYHLTVTTVKTSYNNVESYDAYILEVPEAGLTAADLAGNYNQDSSNAQALIADRTTYGADISASTVYLDQAKTYVLVFHLDATADGAANTVVQSFSLTQSAAAIGDQKYATLTDAITAASDKDEDVIIQVLGDIITSGFTLPENAKLDLNGRVVNAQGKSVHGTITDSTDGGGFLYAAYASDLVNCPGEIILWDQMKNVIEGKSGWRVYKYSYKSRDYEETTADGIIYCKFWSVLSFENPEALDRIETNGQISLVGFKLKWVSEDGETIIEPLPYAFNNTEMSEWAMDEQTAPDGKTYGFYIDIKGFQKIQENGTLTVTPFIETPLTTLYANSVDYIHTVTQ